MTAPEGYRLASLTTASRIAGHGENYWRTLRMRHRDTFPKPALMLEGSWSLYDVDELQRWDAARKIQNNDPRKRRTI